MSKSNDKKKDNKNGYNNQRNHSLLISLLICLGFLFLYIGFQLHNSFLTKHGVNHPKNNEEVISFLTSKSNFSEIVKEWQFDDFWPKEYFEINLNAKKISYWKDTVCYEVQYKDCYDYNLKEFEDEDSKAIFKTLFPQKMNLEDLVEEAYRESINKANIDEYSKYLCFLYNALAGHPNSYVILGRKNVQDNWMYFTPNDFPQYYFNVNNEHLKNYIFNYANKNNNNPKDCYPLNEAVRDKDVIDISVKALSYDRRRDIIWYGDSSKKAGKNDISKLPAPYYYKTLNEVSASGWVVPDKNNEKLKLIRAQEYYRQNDGKIYLYEETIKNLKKLKWNEAKEEPYWYYSFIVGIVLCVFGLIFLIFDYRKEIARLFDRLFQRKAKTNAGLDESNAYIEEVLELFDILKKHVNNPNSTNSLESSELKKAWYGVIDKIIESKEIQRLFHEAQKGAVQSFISSNEYKKAIEDAQNSAVQDFMVSKEYKKAIEDAQNSAVQTFMVSKEYKKAIEDAQNSAVQDFIASKKYKSVTNKSENWDRLISCTEESQVLSFLEKIHNLQQTFPVLQTMAKVYQSAIAKTKVDKEQIAIFLAFLDKQVGKETGLQRTYSVLLDDAEYANTVRNRFEKTKNLAQTYGDREEYKQVLVQSKGRELTIWERVAVMLWATECTNELLAIFGKGYFNQDVVRNASEMHKEDILQIFATRIFKKYINDTSAVGQLTSARDKIMREKVLEMHSKYNIIMKETTAYKEFVSSLDSVHDKIKGEANFIRIMKDKLVNEFVKSEREMKDEGQYLSLLVAMGLHMSDYIRYMSGNDIDYCPNMKFALSEMDISILDKNTEFRYKDPAYSGEYTNRVYEWLQKVGVKHLMALVGNKYIMP